MRVSRLGREKQALDTLEIPSDIAPVSLPELREFHEFTLEPGIRHNIFSPKLLGNLLRHKCTRLLVIDPHILHGPKQVAILTRFLESVRPSDQASYKVRTGRVRGEQRRADFAGWSDQNAAADRVRRQLGTLNLTLEFPADGYFVDHDRVLYFHIKESGTARFYKVILGQGLFGFDAACRRRSHGVWFEIAQAEFEAQWASSAASTAVK